MAKKEFEVRHGLISGSTLVINSAGSWIGNTITEIKGGTAQTTYAQGDILYASGVDTLTKLTAGSDTEVLTLASGVPSWAANLGAPDQNLWLNMDADSGGPVAANITTDTFTITGGTSITTSISGDIVTIVNDDPNVDQNLWLTVAGDGGSTAANITTDTLTIAGGTSITTAMSGDTLTITNDDPNVDQNIWLTIAADVAGPVSANTTTDTLTLAGGTNIISTVSGDTVTFDWTAALNDLSDVTAVGSPTGQILFSDGINWVTLPKGTNGQVLTMGSPLLPSWQTGGGGGDPDQNLWLTIAADSGGPVSANTITDTLTLTGGDGIDSSISGDVVTFAVDSTVARQAANETITGTWTLDGTISESDFGTGGKVKDGTDVARPIGFNVIPAYEIDANDTFDLAHNGMLWHKDSGGSVTFTCANDATIPQGATYLVHNDDTEDLTITGGSPSILSFLAPGADPVLGDVTIEQGGIVTVYKYADNEFWAWGADKEVRAFNTPLNIIGNVPIGSPGPDKVDDVRSLLNFQDSLGETMYTIGTDDGNLEFEMFSRGGIFSFNTMRDDGTLIAAIRADGSTGVIALHHDGSGGASIRTQAVVPTIDGNTSGAQVQNAGNLPLDIGFNLLTWETKNANMTTTDEDWRNHAGLLTYSDDATARVYTTPASSDSIVPDGFVTTIVNLGVGAITIVAGSGVTLRTLNGANTTGTVTVSQYNIVTLNKRSSTLWYAWGGGL